MSCNDYDVPEIREYWEKVILKRHMRQFLTDLKKQAHPIYAMLASAPKASVWIDKDEGDFDLGEEVFTVKEFLSQLGRLNGRRDEFRLSFRVYFFREEWDECAPGWELMENPFNGEDCFCADDRAELTCRGDGARVSAHAGLSVPAGDLGQPTDPHESRNHPPLRLHP